MKKVLLFLTIICVICLCGCNNSSKSGIYKINVHYSLGEKDDETILFSKETMYDIRFESFNIPEYAFLGYYEGDKPIHNIELRDYNLETRYVKLTKEYYDNQAKSLLKCQIVEDRFLVERICDEHDNYYVYKDNYAGKYIDENGILHVELVDGYNNDDDIKFLEENDIEYLIYKFSYNYMQSIMNAVNDIALEAGVVSVGMEDRYNYVLIDMTEVDKVEFVTNYLKSIGLFDSDAIVINANPNNRLMPNSRIIQGGEGSYKYVTSTEAYATTICTNAVKNNTGELGVITCGHLGLVGTETYYETMISNGINYGTHLGIISNSYTGGSIDGAFITFEDQSDWIVSPYSSYGSTVYTNVYLGNNLQIAYGNTVVRIGQTTGCSSGIITAVNKTFYLNGTPISESFKISNYGAEGDSGGPVFYSYNGALYLIGLYYGTQSDFIATRGVACSILNIMLQFGVTPITNDSFDTTNLLDDTLQLDGINYNISGSFNITSSAKDKIISKIGSNAFEYYGGLTKVCIPNTIVTIGNEAFKNCSNLDEVVINKANLPLTSLGTDVFNGCSSSLQIKVPNDMIADYKNMTNWSTYSNKIVPYTNDFTTINMTSSTNTSQTLTLDAGYNKLYKLNVINQGTYDVRASTSTNTTIKLYDSNYNLLETKSKVLTKTLSTGIYYVSIAYQSNTQSGTLYPSFKVHSHSYVDHYQWTSMTEHKSYCSCNGYITSSHVVSPDAYQNGNQYAICLLCNGFASFGGTWHDGIGSFPYTLNGSFILPNGVIVLEEADMEAYLNGTLVFINPNDNIDRNNHTEYYYREEECERIY